MDINRRKILGWFYNRLENKADVEDLTQEVMIKILYYNPKTYPYLWAIVRSVYINYIKSIKPIKDYAYGMITNDTPDSYAIAREIYSSLPTEVKLYSKGYTYQEIVEKTGVSPHTISNRLKNARESVK